MECSLPTAAPGIPTRPHRKGGDGCPTARSCVPQGRCSLPSDGQATPHLQAPAIARAWCFRPTPRLHRRVPCAGRRRPALWYRKPCVWPSFPSVSALQSRPRRPAGTAGKRRKSSRQPGMNEESVTGKQHPGDTSLNPVCHAALQTRLKTCRPTAHK